MQNQRYSVDAHGVFHTPLASYDKHDWLNPLMNKN